MIQPRNPTPDTYGQTGRALCEPSRLISPQQAAADKRAFMRKHGNTATKEELRADLAAAARRLRNFQGLSWDKIGKELGVTKDTAHALVDPEFERNRTRQALARQARAKERKAAA